MVDDLKNTLRITRKIEGWLTDAEGVFLYHQAKKCKEGAIVEIGSWKGKSTVWLGKGSSAGYKIPIFAVDPHTGSCEHQAVADKVWTFDEFKNNIKIANLENVIMPIIKTSEEAAKDWNNPIGFIFIDGAHEYELVELDFKLWFPFLVNGGVMAFHDSFAWSGPRKVVKKYIYKSNLFKNIKFADSITFATRCNKINFKDKIKNYLAYFIRIIYEMIGAGIITTQKLAQSHKKSSSN